MSSKIINIDLRENVSDSSGCEVSDDDEEIGNQSVRSHYSKSNYSSSELHGNDDSLEQVNQFEVSLKNITEQEIEESIACNSSVRIDNTDESEFKQILNMPDDVLDYINSDVNAAQRVSLVSNQDTFI